MSSLLKNGWHPGGERKISRETWKKDIRNLGSRKDEGRETALNHVSAPLTTLKDPDSFGPPPKHAAYYPNAQSPVASSSASRPAPTGLGAPVPSTPARPKQEVEEEKPPAGPYRVNTTGLRTDNLPKPPARRDGTGTPISASTPVARPVPSLPPRQATAGPPPVLPPRQSEHPNEYAPAPPPTYGEAMQSPQSATALNTSAIDRLGQAGVSVPGLGIRSGTTSASQPASGLGHSNQLSELQQRFSKMSSNDNASPTSQSAAPVPSWKQAKAIHTAATTSSSPTGGLPITPSWKQAQAMHTAATSTPPGTGAQNTNVLPNWKQAQALHTAAAASPAASAGIQSAFSSVGEKKKPPPPPAKRHNLTTEANTEGSSGAPPPIPMSSKPRPG